MLDWVVLGGYFVVLALTGVYFSRREQKDTNDYFLGGRRIMASGVRVFIGSIPASIILFGDAGLEPVNLCIAIGVLTAVGIVYTLAGGISSVIWTDVIQMGVLLGACVLAIWLIASQLPIGAAETIDLLRANSGSPKGSKLTVFQFGSDADPWWTRSFSLPAVVVGFTLMGIASYGTDQDLTQRMLTCRDEKAAARSVIGGILFGVPSVALFLVVLLLWVFYQQPEMWRSHGLEAPTVPEDSRRVFLNFIIDHMPPGVTGLMMAGLFAAGLSSLNSGINAMASTFVNDFYRRFVPGRDEKHYLRTGRFAVVARSSACSGRRARVNCRSGAHCSPLRCRS